MLNSGKIGEKMGVFVKILSIMSKIAEVKSKASPLPC